mmetsp:Transcript_13086/g.26549  ORF Transcript_13086/g.26549 Transcript_13086/m.26549 type:complete len:227 (+) Transcript_13086:227-907(+)
MHWAGGGVRLQAVHIPACKGRRAPRGRRRPNRPRVGHRHLTPAAGAAPNPLPSGRAGGGQARRRGSTRRGAECYARRLSHWHFRRRGPSHRPDHFPGGRCSCLPNTGRGARIPECGQRGRASPEGQAPGERRASRCRRRPPSAADPHHALRRLAVRVPGARLRQQEAGRAREVARLRTAKGGVRGGGRRGYVPRCRLHGRQGGEVRARRRGGARRGGQGHGRVCRG